MSETRFTDPKGFQDFVDAALADSAEPDPTVVAQKILDNLKPNERMVALSVTLRRYVQDRSRNGARAARDPEPLRPVEPRSKTVARSIATKVRVDWKANLLRQRLFNGSEHRFMAECTADDLFSAAKVRMNLAASNRVEGERLAALAKTMKSKRYRTVADVPESVLRETFVPQAGAA